jgi:cell division septation protein DedD
MAVKNETWLIVAIVVIAGVLIALSFTKDRSVKPVTVAAEAIKPDHSTADMAKIAAEQPKSDVVGSSTSAVNKPAFAVQVFSFKEKSRADVSLQQLKDKGYPAYVMMSDLGPRGVFYRVRVGSFATEQEAKQSLESVTRDFKSGIIVAE